MPKCLFCGRTNHHFWECKQVKIKDERIAILKKDFPNNCISCGFKHNKQHCNPRSKCKDHSCTKTNGKHNRLTCPKFLQLNTTSVHQVNIVDKVHGIVEETCWCQDPHCKQPKGQHHQSINVANIEGKSVALPTAIYTANNPNALKLPLHQRNVAILADSAAQRTLVAKDTAEKLGHNIIGTESACLIGYGTKRPQNNSFNVV